VANRKRVSDFGYWFPHLRMSNGVFQARSPETIGKTTQFFPEVQCRVTNLTGYREGIKVKPGSGRTDAMTTENVGGRYRGRRISDLPPDQLKLGKGAWFVKTHLKRLPQVEDVWEADFQPYPEPEQGKRRRAVSWIGTVVSQTSYFILADVLVDLSPTVNDLAGLLARAMRHPMKERSHRPTQILLRENPLWHELLPHLKELRIEVSTQEKLPEWDAMIEEFAQDLKNKAQR
jgi:hypothetical protein